jgi:tetratricopeptide (TPR) repeat protein
MTGARARALFFIGIFTCGTALTVSGTDAFAQVKTEKAAADQRARELFQKGDVAYAEGRYEEALGAFSEAYELSGRAQLLFNVSNALERLGRYQEAVDALEKYLASGKAKDRDVVQKRLANLKKRVEEQKKEQDKVAKEEEEKRKKEEEERQKREGQGGGNQGNAGNGPTGPTGPKEPEQPPAPVLPWILIGGGGVVFATGAVFGILTLGARSDAKNGCTDAPSGHLCSEEASSALDREKTFGLVADIGMLSGLVLAGVGTYLLLTNKPSHGLRALEPHVKVGVRPGGIVFAGAF